VTPSPFDLPLRPSEATEVARLVLDLASSKLLTDDIRHRIAVRVSALRLETLRPWFGSLAPDPLRAGFYLAADGLDSVPLLLHLAPASAPTGSVFPKALLIGRAGNVVVNAIPFGLDDRANLETFVARVDPAFQPKAQGARSAIVAPPTAAAFDAFRRILKRTGRNLAATEGPYHRALWCAIRAGWREGWSAGGRLDDSPLYSRFIVPAEGAAQARVRIAQLRAAAKISRPFDLEVSFEDAASPTTPEDIAAVRAEWIAPLLGPATRLDALASAAQHVRALLALRAPAAPLPGRSVYKVTADTEDLDAIAAALA